MSAPRGAVQLLPLTGVPEVEEGDDLAALLHAGARPWGGLQDGDVLVVSSKVVSKAAGLRILPEASGDEGSGHGAGGGQAGAAQAEAQQHLREEAVARHTVRVVAERATATGTTRVVQALAGPVMAAAGVDASNTGPRGGVLLLPEDPDAAARELHAALLSLRPGLRLGVVLSDTAGRPWRSGQTDLALGAAHVQVLEDLRGARDLDGRELAVTARALGDELAAAADLVKGKAGGVAAAVVRGLPHLVPSAEEATEELTGARSLVRTGPGDWFALGHREAVRAALGAAPGTRAAAEVGIASVAPEPVPQRAARAVRLALLGEPGVSVQGDVQVGYAVRSPDPFRAGRVAARLEVALAGEDLTAEVRCGRGQRE